MTYSNATLDQFIEQVEAMSQEQLVEATKYSGCRLAQLADVLKNTGQFDDNDQRSYIRHSMVIAFAIRQLRIRNVKHGQIMDIIFSPRSKAA